MIPAYRYVRCVRNRPLGIGVFVWMDCLGHKDIYLCVSGDVEKEGLRDGAKRIITMLLLLLPGPSVEQITVHWPRWEQMMGVKGPTDGSITIVFDLCGNFWLPLPAPVAANANAITQYTYIYRNYKVFAAHKITNLSRNYIYQWAYHLIWLSERQWEENWRLPRKRWMDKVLINHFEFCFLLFIQTCFEVRTKLGANECVKRGAGRWGGGLVQWF